jgi:hypothetical protein
VSQEAPRTVSEALRLLLREPYQRLWRRWNWKAALTSSLVRGTLFFAINLTHSANAAGAAFATEFVLRALTSGFYGSVTQLFSAVEPKAAGTAAAIVVLPALSHSVELAVHWLRGTEALASSIAASVLFTIVSTTFNLHAMRDNVLTVGEGSRSIASDFRRLPGLVLTFLGFRGSCPT